MKRKLLIALGAMLLAFAAFSVASAHAKLDHCTPAVGSTVATAPAQVVCVYSEEIDTKQSTISVWNASSTQVDRKDAHVDLNDPDHKTLIVSLDTANTPNGLYTVKWHAVTPDDGGISDGTWQFIIGNASATPYPPTEVIAGETAAAGTPNADGAASTATLVSSNATATPAAAVVTATVAPPSTAPSTGGGSITGWILLGVIGLLLLLGGTLVRARR